MKKIKFSVASALLRELGERLVGRPHIALAELIKNSYDADATKVRIRLTDDRLEVVDNGHGMSFDEFEKYWMRIGSPHKQEDRYSRKLSRPMTGSKGVGRLAVQFLAQALELSTVAAKPTAHELTASVDWDQAVKAGDLTEAVAEYKEGVPNTRYPGGARHGTAIVLSNLNQEWAPSTIVDLAREIWWLQPPFRSNTSATTRVDPGFDVELEGVGGEVLEEFNGQMHAYLDIWHARIVGKMQPKANAPPRVQLTLEFSDGTKIRHEYDAMGKSVRRVDFEVRIYHLAHRQPRGISVKKAREYLNRFGGVHVYDSGFHLPYYGPETDWLNTEIAHSHRKSLSSLLPTELQVQEGLNYLPTLSRMLGVVHVDTTHERKLAEGTSRKLRGDHLQIQVTRDRLVDNAAFQALRDIVRYSLDFYAMEEAKRALLRAEASRDTEPAHEQLERFEETLARFGDVIPKHIYTELQDSVSQVLAASKVEAEIVRGQSGLLGSLATAGISALAFQHEIGQQFAILESAVERLRDIRAASGKARGELLEVAEQIEEWLTRARATRAMFSHLLDTESREAKGRYKARAFLEDVVAKMQILIRGPKVDIGDMDDRLRLPKGTVAEWSAIFQNVVLNSANAMIDAKRKVIAISSRRRGMRRSVVIQDTGRGVDLESADELFRPFVRKLEVANDRRALGLGGTGLGLAIVKMIADGLGCRVAFVAPDAGFRSAFEVSWRERE